MNKMNEDELERKLKRERVEVCLSCQRFVECENIGKYELCDDFIEVVESEVFAIFDHSKRYEKSCCV